MDNTIDISIFGCLTIKYLRVKYFVQIILSKLINEDAPLICIGLISHDNGIYIPHVIWELLYNHIGQLLITILITIVTIYKAHYQP